jgi:hypothetical protein
MLLLPGTKILVEDAKELAAAQIQIRNSLQQITFRIDALQEKSESHLRSAQKLKV